MSSILINTVPRVLAVEALGCITCSRSSPPCHHSPLHEHRLKLLALVTVQFSPDYEATDEVGH
jgi:hypothetical protein